MRFYPGPLTPRRIVFSGYYGLGNGGDEAVLAGLIAGCRRLNPNLKFAVLSADPERTRLWHGVDAVLRMRPGVMRAIRGCDVLVSGGGSLLQDVTSLSSLGYYLGIIGLGKSMGKPAVIAAQGIGPLNRAVSQWAVGMVLNRVDAVSVRDDDSADLLRRCGVTRPISVTADAALLLDPVHLPCGGNRPIGIALRSWPGRDSVTWGASVSADLISRGHKVRLIPMQEPIDRALAEAIRARCPAVELAGFPTRLDDLMEAIGGCAAVLAMRLHAMILAALHDVPSVAWTYDPKVDAQAARLGIQVLGPETSPEDAARAIVQSLIPSEGMASRVAQLRSAAEITAQQIVNAAAG